MFTLRPYQKQAVDKLLWSQKLDGADLCVLPTGAGKSLVIAEFSANINKPLLILQPSKEILEQNLSKLLHYVPVSDVGVYSASMDRKDIARYTLGTIQSVYKHPELFEHLDVVLVDECHLINPKSLDGMYNTFFKAIGAPKVIGLTASPYRMDVDYERIDAYNVITHTTTKLINRVRPRFWHRIMFNINIGDLIKDGYLTPLQYLDYSRIAHKDIPTNASGSDFSMPAFEEQIKIEDIRLALASAMSRAKSVLVFCSSIEQAEFLQQTTKNSAVVTSKTNKKTRTDIINGFKSREIQTVFNVGVLTTGFDFPELDCIVMLRPTRSVGLYYQMLGRGVRSAPGKTGCLVIDLTSNVKEMGRIETIRLEKQDNWELLTETGSWHKKRLYSFEITK